MNLDFNEEKVDFLIGVTSDTIAEGLVSALDFTSQG